MNRDMLIRDRFLPLVLSVLLIVSAGVCFAQNSVIQFSTISSGFSLLSAPGTSATSIAGQTVVDDARQLNTHIESGFLVFTRKLPYGLLTSASDTLARNGTNYDIVFPISPNITTIAETLFYRRGGEAGYTGGTLTRINDTLRGIIPPPYVTIRGIEYYFELNTSTGSTITYPAVNPTGAPAQIPVVASGITYPLPIAKRTYKMISAPLDLSTFSTNIIDVLGDDYGKNYPKNIWRIFRWEKGGYQEYPNIAAKITPGTSFWLITQPGTPFSIDSGWSVFSPPAVGTFPIILEPGWNQIADPFAYGVLWRQIVASSQIPDTLVSRPNLYNGVEYVPADVLMPWEGYFVFNTLNTPLTISIPPVEAPLNPSAHLAISDEPVSRVEYSLRLTAEISEEGLKDSYNYLGFWKNSTPLRERMNDLEPPQMGDFVRLSIIENQKEFMTRFAEVPKDGRTWSIHVSSTSAKRQVHVSLNESGRIPDGFQMFLLDMDNGNMIPTERNMFTLQLGEALQERSLKMIIGTKEYAASQSGNIPLVPMEYALEQNYPNPFNPETNIRYQLRARSDVRLEVFDLLGQRVKTLVSSEQMTGSYAVAWDAKNDAGVSLSSGVYFFRFQARSVSGDGSPDFVATRKLILVR